MRRLFKRWIPVGAGMTILFLFSFFLMFHTFSYDGQKQEIRIAAKLWSDFGAHIPLIRSFTYGANFTRLFRGQPIESPLFPGEPIRYHFGFYALVGTLEKAGLPLDWALNLPSAIGLIALIGLIWALAGTLFQSPRVALLSVLFFLFNGSLAFLTFFKAHPLSLHTFSEIFTNSRFPAFGPWDGGEITAFWTLNVFTNQRHLALSYALILLPLLAMVKHQTPQALTTLIVASSASTLLFINHAAAAILFLFLFWIFLYNKNSRPRIFVVAVLGLLVFLLAKKLMNLSPDVTFQPGYLIKPPLTLYTFLRFWWLNLGLHSLLIPLGVILSPKSVRRLMAPPLLTLFILPNLFRFSPDMINNHKFFNFFVILGNMFSAYALVRVFSWRKIGKLVGLVGLVGLVLSGLIDFFPVLNDAKGSLPDLATNPDIRFFATQVPPEAVAANSTWFYHPASPAGRPIFSGYTYFTWSYGYNQGKREADLIAIYQAENQEEMCQLLKQHNISFVELAVRPEEYLKPNWKLWNNLKPIYENPETHLRIYSTEDVCGKYPL